MTFVETWDETFPSDTQVASLGADDIRGLTKAIRERLAIDHYFLAIEGGDAKIGYHKSGTFVDQTADLLGVTAAVRLYGKTISGKVELFLVMADNTVVQITSGGKLNAAAIAGVIPIANLATGTPDGTKFIRDDGTLVVPDKSANAGEVVQVVNVMSGAVATGTTAIPVDDSIPQNNEGDEYMTLAITPKSATNKLKIEVVVNGANGAGDYDVAALFQDTTAGALAAASINGAVSVNDQIVFTHYMDAGTTSATTFKVRAGVHNAGTFTFNGKSAGRIFGGVIASSITITEIKV